MKTKKKIKKPKYFQDQLDSHVQVIEDSVAETAQNISRDVAKGLKGMSNCSSEKMFVNSFNCLKTIDFHIERMKGSLDECFDGAGSNDAVNKCLNTMKNDINTLKNKLGKGYSCSLVTSCQEGQKKKGKPKYKTEYCLSHTGNGVSQKCLKKIKDGSLYKMSKADIDKYIGSTVK